MSILLIFGPAISFFSVKSRFIYLRLSTLLFCLPLTSAYLLLVAPENGIHLLTLGLSLVIMVIVSEEEYRTRAIGICTFIILLVFLAIFRFNYDISWPQTLYWWHIFYFLGFLFVILLVKESMQTLVFEKELAVLEERCKIAQSISHEITTPMLVLRLLLQKKSSEIGEKEKHIIKRTIKEISKIIDCVVPQDSKDYTNLPLVSINKIIKNCIIKRNIIYKNCGLQLISNEEIVARVNSASFTSVITNLFNVCLGAMPLNGGGMVVETGRDMLGNFQILMKSSNENLSIDMLNKIFSTNEELREKVGFGTDFSDIRNTVKDCHGQIFIKNSKAWGAVIQILLPDEHYLQVITEDNKKFIVGCVQKLPKSNQYILVDSDEDYMETTKIQAQQKALKLKFYQTIDEMLKDLLEFSKNDCFLFDWKSNQAKDIISVLRKLNALGFKNLILVSDALATVPRLAYVSYVVDKRLPVFEVIDGKN